MNKNSIFILLILFASTHIKAQVESYQYKKAIVGVTEQWHKIELPPTAFKNLNKNYSDIRVFGFTDKDTIEVPYLLKESTTHQSSKILDFKRINESKNSKGYYYTFLLNELSVINKIFLNFGKSNFNFETKLEGSFNNKEWFTILDNYQLIGVKNEYVDFSFSTLNFNQSSYKYYRLLVKTKSDPALINASISFEESEDVLINVFKVIDFKQTNNSESKKSIIEFSLEEALPVSQIKLNVNDSMDYYRRYQLSYLADSIKTEKGYIQKYQFITSGTVHSFEQTIMRFRTIVASHFKIEIENNDNTPLTIENTLATGNRFFLKARFTSPANYFLYYGNKKSTIPKYDISYFKDKIPENLIKLDLGLTEKTIRKEEAKSNPLFVNSIWMYVILSITIAILAIFSIKMLRNTKISE